MANTYKTATEYIRDCAKFELDAVKLIRTGAYRRTASGMLVADTAKAPKTYIL